MKLRETGILGVVILESPIYRDDRGYFLEGYNEQQFLELGLPIDWKQDNLSGVPQERGARVALSTRSIRRGNSCA